MKYANFILLLAVAAFLVYWFVIRKKEDKTNTGAGNSAGQPSGGGSATGGGSSSPAVWNTQGDPKFGIGSVPPTLGKGVNSGIAPRAATNMVPQLLSATQMIFPKSAGLQVSGGIHPQLLGG